MSVADIAKKVDSSTNLVDVVKSKGNGAGKARSGSPSRHRCGNNEARRGSAAEAAAGTNGPDGIVAAARQAEQDRARMRTAPERIGGIVNELLR